MLVQEVVALVIKKGYKVNNLDIVVQADEPNLKEYKPMMKLAIAQMLGIDPEDVGLKATTLEGMGSAKKGIAAYAVVSLIKR